MRYDQEPSRPTERSDELLERLRRVMTRALTAAQDLEDNSYITNRVHVVRSLQADLDYIESHGDRVSFQRSDFAVLIAMRKAINPRDPVTTRSRHLRVV